MKSLEFLNAVPPVIHDNFNRDCSLIKTSVCVNLLTRERVPAFIAHSAAHRSTYSANEAEHGETYRLFWWVKDTSSQSAINCAVESIQAGFTVATTWRKVIETLHPGVRVHGGDVVKHASVPIRADVPSGKLTLRISADSFPQLLCELERRDYDY